MQFAALQMSPCGPGRVKTLQLNFVRYCGASERQLLGELRKWLARAQNVEDDPTATLATGRANGSPKLF
jgi:hypothetical protein